MGRSSGTDLDGLSGRVRSSGFRDSGSGVDLLIAPLTIATWNVQEGLPADCGSRPARTRQPTSVAEPINRHEVDVIALQEVDFDRHGRSQVLHDVRANTNLRHIRKFPFSPSAFFPDARAGVAIASRYPIRQRREFILPNPGLRITRGGRVYDSYDKGVLVCEIDADGWPLTVVSLHMFPFHMFERAADHDDFDVIWRTLRTHLGESSARGPLVVAGDFNTDNRGLLREIDGRPLTGTTRGQVTHRGYAADDILFSPEVPDPPTARVVETFSDHRLCLVDLGE